jgi:hypothetical protein
LEGKGADGIIILKIVLREESMKSVYLAEYRDVWWAVVILVMNRYIPLDNVSCWMS